MDANEIAFELIGLKEHLDKLEFDNDDNIKSVQFARSKITEAVDALHSLKDE